MSAADELNENQDQEQPTDRQPTVIVGIGAAAGGIDALEKFFSAVSDDCGITFVVVQHLGAEGEEVQRDLISHFTRLPLDEIGEATPLEANHVYVAKPHCTVSVEHGELRSVHLTEAKHRRALVDNFFQSLAECYQSAAVGIVLSGAGTDGTLGLKAISDAGGMTMAQALESAKFDSMPRNAVATGVVDHVLPPVELPAELIAYARHVAGMLSKDRAGDLQEEIKQVLLNICNVLMEQTEHDFKHYKSNTLVRRVARRIQVLKVPSAEDYLNRIRADREELQSLFRELLIGVTSFFRDPETFATLSNLVISRLIQSHTSDDPIRVWVPGCASGEEVYTLAILFREATSELDSPPDLQLFGTDINERALGVARQGTYALEVADYLSEQRLKRFLVRKGNRYHVAKEIRDICTFSVHNLISDPPFSRMDLISCRNLLIYLGPHLQKKLIPLFHFALRPNGFLLLGPSENLSSHRELFRPIDKKHRISQRKAGSVRPSSVLASAKGFRGVPRSPDESPSSSDADIYQIMQSIIVDEFSPQCAVVNDDFHVLCTTGGIEKYLKLSAGTFQNDIVKMAQPSLRGGLRAGLHEAHRIRRMVTHEKLSVSEGDVTQPITLVIQPMPQLGDETGLFLVVFQESGPPITRDVTTEHSSAEDVEALVEQLERELSTTRDDLERTVQELEVSNEELKSSNEELLSMNEELQTANEELETSKEEIQTGLEALSRANTDLENLLTSTEIATIFVDEQLNIKSFTPAATKIYNLIPGDVGRRLAHTTHRAIEMPPLPDAAVFETVSDVVQDEVQTTEGHWFVRRVLPYRSSDAQIQGMVITFINITQRKLAEMRLATEHAVTRALSDADSFDDASYEILEAIRSCLAADVCLLWLRDHVAGDLYCAEIAQKKRPGRGDLQPFIDRSREIRFTKGTGLPGRVWQTGQPHLIEDITEDANFPRGRQAAASGLVSGIGFPMLSGKKFRGEIELFTTRKLTQDERLLDMMASIGSEIGLFVRRTHLRRQLEQEQARNTAILDSALDCIITMDHRGRVVDFNGVAEATLGYPHEEAVGKPLAELLIPDRFRDQHRAGLNRFLKTGSSDMLGKRIELTGMRSDGSEFPVEIAINVIRSDQEAAPFFTAYLRDITARKQAEEKLRQSESDARRFAMLVEHSSDFIGIAKPDGTVIYVNRAGRRMVGLDQELDVTTTEFMDYIAPEHRDVMLHEAIPTVASQGRWKGPVNYRHFKTGESIPTLWNAFIIEDPGGELPSVWVTISPDLSEQKRMEDALRESAAENARLYEQAQIANQTKSEFLANMSHEIRTPMTAVLGYADLLAARLKGSEELDFLQTIKRNGRFLLEIINDILDLSKIEAGKIEINPEQFSVEQIVADIYSSMLVRANEKGLNFQVEYEGKVPESVESDPTRVRQVLLNLIGNAMKFTETGSVLLKIRFLPDDDNPLLQFEVVDTGIGIESDHQSRLFQPFSQGDSSVTRKYGGTGLGLIISRRLAALLGGDIRVESELGRGSTFYVSISTGSVNGVPMVQPDGKLEPANEVVDEPEKRAGTLGCRVLVVDDRRDVRHLARIMLTKAGAQVAEANDGQAAIDAIEKSETDGAPYDVILLDMQMPTLDGYQTAARLRENGYQRPIVALTADAMRGDRERCLAAGCDGYLTKPVDGNELIQIVEHFATTAGRDERDADSTPRRFADDGADENRNSGRRVLVVDDSVDACSATGRLLSLEGFEVQTAYNGISAIDTAREFRPHAVVLDISLPDIDGYEVLRRLRESAEFTDTRFIALSGHAQPDDIDRAREAGFRHHVQKPADLDELLRLLRD